MSGESNYREAELQTSVKNLDGDVKKPKVGGYFGSLFKGWLMIDW